MHETQQITTITLMLRTQAGNKRTELQHEPDGLITNSTSKCLYRCYCFKAGLHLASLVIAEMLSLAGISPVFQTVVFKARYEYIRDSFIPCGGEVQMHGSVIKPTPI